MLPIVNKAGELWTDKQKKTSSVPLRKPCFELCFQMFGQMDSDPQVDWQAFCESFSV